MFGHVGCAYIRSVSMGPRAHLSAESVSASLVDCQIILRHDHSPVDWFMEVSIAFSNFGPAGQSSKYRWKVQRLLVPAHVRLPSWWCPGVPQRHFMIKIGLLEPCTMPCTLIWNRSFCDWGSSDGHAMYDVPLPIMRQHS